MAETIIRVISVLPSRDGWIVHDENKETVHRSPDRARAIRAGRRLAKKKHGQLVIYKSGGVMESAEDFASVER